MKGTNKPKARPKPGSGMIKRHKDAAKARERGGGKGTYWGAVKNGGKR